MWKSSYLSSKLLFLISFMMFIMSLYLFMFSSSILIEWDLSLMNSTSLMFYTYIDPQGTILSSVVLFISANIMTFATFYMMDELYLNRFIHLVLAFVLSMNFLIFFPHFMGLLLGWDGLGITSFLLVIYYLSPKSLGAGMITALTNRIGDVLLLISIAITLHQSHWNILTMWDSSFNFYLIFMITMAAMTKSAQIPFSSWLPAAMAAPTPVSALVHSSTLVTAGVFLLYRFYPFLKTQPLFFLSLMIISSFTMLMAGIAAMNELDLKKIIALSTLSQLGVMMSALALGLPNLALFHLMTHALFKALLFVCAGSLIHMNSHNQDLRTAGMILPQMPSISSTFLISNIALCGLPFLAAFYSKDMILEMSVYSPLNWIISLFFSFATMLTALYTARFLLSVWMTPHQHQPLHSIYDNYNESFIPANTLALGAIVGGALLNWVFFLPSTEPILAYQQKFTPFIMTSLGLLIGIFISSLSTSSSLYFFITMISSSSMWFLTPISSQGMLKMPFILSNFLTKYLDQGWTELAGGQGTMLFSSSNSKLLSILQINSPMIHLSTALCIILPLSLLM